MRRDVQSATDVGEAAERELELGGVLGRGAHRGREQRDQNDKFADHGAGG
jgi:hypothetical protein